MPKSNRRPRKNLDDLPKPAPKNCPERPPADSCSGGLFPISASIEEIVFRPLEVPPFRSYYSLTKPTFADSSRRRSLMSKDTLTITDNRTGKTYELPIVHDTIHATDLRQIKVKDDDFGMMTYDPAFMNTALCKSTDHLYRRRQRHSSLPRVTRSSSWQTNARISKSPT